MKRLLPIATVFVPVAFLYLLGGFEFLERSRVDVGFRLDQREARSGIVVVEIDPKSLQALGVWPWPRGYHATVLERLLEADARRVGFDVEFSSRSDPEEDAELTRALAVARGKVVLPVFREWQEAEPDEVHLTIVQPLPEFARHATLASINVRPETDGLVRRYTNRTRFDNRALPGFAPVLAGDPRPDLESFYIDYGVSSRSIPRLSYVDVLTGQFDPAAVRGKAVIIGSTAVELGDQIAVPVAAALPGPLLQALAFESLTQGRALERTNRWSTLLVCLLLAVVMMPLFQRTSWRGGLLLMLACSAALLTGAGIVERFRPVLLDAMPWIFTTLGLYGLALAKRIDQQALGLLRQRMRIHRTETLMEHVVQNSFDAIVTLGVDSVVETFNRSAEFTFGYSESEAVGMQLPDLVGPVEEGMGESLLARATEGPVEGRGRSRDGRLFPVEVVVTAIDTEDDPKLVVVIRDITERKAHQEELKHQATHDHLTDLPNRALFMDRAERTLAAARARGGRVAVMLLDLDRFKEINDALGHAMGDILLRAVAKRLGTPLDCGDTLARLGGDEFAVLLPETTVQQAEARGRELIEVLKAPFAIEGFSLQVDTSLGITIFPVHGTDAEALVQRADVAMYVAKEQRCGLVTYGPEQDFDHVRQLTIKGELRHAIERGQLHLVYQPKVDHATDRIVGVEALLRWRHPEHGFIPPDEFTGVAEHSGLIRPLTQWVLETALEQAARWRDEGIPVGMSVNLSARNLLEEDLVLRLEGLLAHHGLAPQQLTLEITESVIMDDPERALVNMHRLRELGVGISVDDFGTGYSSLAYLMQLPANELKIDKSFVMRLDSEDGTATIVRSTIELAHNLGMQVVAEGVESAEVWSVLKELGCDIGQGYFFSRPVKAREMFELMQSSFECATDDALQPQVFVAPWTTTSSRRST
jgi:diguanylate cyclase (GGDEF)-like protein/PAS domain S-box-containing protein